MMIIAERAERSEAAELICHLSAWCKMYMKFLPNFYQISTYLLRDFQNVPFFKYLVIPKFYYGELNIAQKLAETPPKRYQINLVPKPLYIKDLLISLPPGLYVKVRGPGTRLISAYFVFCFHSDSSRRLLL